VHGLNYQEEVNPEEEKPEDLIARGEVIRDGLLVRVS